MNENTEESIITILEIVGVAIVAFVVLLITGKPIKAAKPHGRSKNSHEAKLQRNKFAYMNKWS